MIHKKYMNGVAVKFSGPAPNPNALKPISKFDRIQNQANGKQFGGKIRASNIPSQYARSGILARAQAFEDVSHSGMIRID